MQIGANLITFNIFSSAGENSIDSILEKEKLQVQSENKDCQVLLAEGMVDIQKKNTLGNNYYLDFSFV